MLLKYPRIIMAAALALSSLYAAAGLTPAAAQEKYVTIGTGGQTGVYFVVGQSICKLVNRETSKHGIKCTAPSTGGSVDNINSIRSGARNMGVAQSDVQYYSLKGTGPFDGQGAYDDLHAVFSVHPEPFTVIARADSGIKTFDDLKGKRVNIGNPGSGQRGTMEVLMEKLGWTLGDFALASELKAAEQSAALCDNKVDAIIYAVGHPNGSIQEASTSCDSVLVPVTGPVVDELIAANPYYAKAVVPGGMYRGSDEDTETFGVLATFVSSAGTDADTVHAVVAAVFDNFDRFKKLHPAFENLDAQAMIKDGLSAPLHDGAVAYYKEQGWM